MTNVNLRDLYPFDETSAANSAPGGLPGLLQQVMPHWRAQPGLLPSNLASLYQQPSKAFDAQQLQALARDPLTQPLSSGSADVDVGAPRDPNFRQLISRPQGINQRTPTSESPPRSDTPSRVALNVPPAGFDSRVTDSADLRSSDNGAGAPSLVPVGGYSSPFPEGSLPLAPRIWPHPRDEDVAAMWKAIKGAWEHFQELRSTPLSEVPGLTIESLIRQFPGVFTRVAAPAADEPSPECKEEIRNAREDCSEAFANGWKGKPHLGPYKNPDGRPWNVNDCVRGIVSEACRPQGNPVEQPPPPKVKKYNLRPRKKKTSAYDLETDEASA